jgi:hypothetical protein
MHQLVLITALSATTGLFGGGKHCGKAHHGKKAFAASCYSASPCGGTYAAHQGMPVPSSQGGYPTSPQAYPTAPPAPAKMAPPAPMAPPVPPTPTPSSAGLNPTGLAPAVVTGDPR